MWRIFQLYKVTIAEIVELNNFSSQNVTIHPGQNIIVKKGTAVTNPEPDSDPSPEPGDTSENTINSYSEYGTFTANRSIAIHNQPKETSASVATLYSGEAVTYDSVYVTNKFVYISYVSYSGVHRYVAIRTHINGRRGPVWGTIV